MDHVQHGSVKKYVNNLATRHGITYVKTDIDVWADAVTRVSDDEVKLDPTELLIIALVRAGVIQQGQVVPLHVRYLREKLGKPGPGQP